MAREYNSTVDKNKADIRSSIRRELLIIDDKFLRDNSLLLSSHLKKYLKKHCPLKDSVIYGGFAPLKGEPRWYLDFSEEMMNAMSFPFVKGKNQMQFKKSRIGDLVLDRSFGIELAVPLGLGEIVEPTAIFIPGLAFTQTGQRLGRGRGFFDRYLNRGKIHLKIGLCFELQLKLDLPVEDHDQKMDVIITEDRIIYCNGENNL